MLNYLSILAITTMFVASTISVSAQISTFAPPANYPSSVLNVAQKPESRGRANQVVTIVQQLDLTSTQKQQIEQIRRQYQDEIKQQEQNLISAQRSLMEMMAGENSATDIRSQHQKVTELQQKLGELRFESMLAVREVLTPEQRQKFAQIMRSRSASFTQEEVRQKSEEKKGSTPPMIGGTGQNNARRALRA